MTTLTLVRGLPSSGKTTYSKKWVAHDPEQRVRINRDDLREMMFGTKVDLSYSQETEVTRAEKSLAENAIKAGKDIIVDAMHLRPKYIREWYSFAAALGVEEVDIVPLYEPLPTLIARDETRANWVGADTIQTLHSKFTRKGDFLPAQTYEEYLEDQPPEPDGSLTRYSPDTTKPKAVIVDIDGTVAKMDGRSPYDYSLVSTDKRNHEVADLVELLSGSMHIIYVSGRPDSCREDTEEWLRANIWTSLGGVTQDDCLYMRKEEDGRPDTTVKLEIFNKYIRDNYNVRFVLDDRNSVVEMWRNLGLTCLQVDEGNF